jgi:hypothetical protein
MHMNKLTKISVTTRKRWQQCGAGLAAAMVLAGCSTLGGNQGPEGQVTQRSNEFWKVRMAGEVGKAYAFTTPGYRAVNSQEKYRLNYGAVPILKGGDIASIKCEELRCEVRKSFTTSSPMMGDTEIPIAISEVWVKEDGQWWLFME